MAKLVVAAHGHGEDRAEVIYASRSSALVVADGASSIGSGAVIAKIRERGIGAQQRGWSVC